MYVLAAVERGLQHVRILMHDTPHDVQTWIKNKHNAFHAGGRMSFVELIELTGPVEAAWAAYRKANNITVDSCPRKGPHRYEALYMNFVAGKFPEYENWDIYRFCKQFHNRMLALKIYDQWKKEMESTCDFLSESLDTKRMIRLSYDICMLIFENFNGQMDEQMLSWSILELLMFVTPLDQSLPLASEYAELFNADSDAGILSTMKLLTTHGLIDTFQEEGC